MKFLDEKMYNLIKSRFFTIYYDGGKNNMIPNVYAEDLISLREGFNRYSIVTKFVYNGSGECINFSFNRFIIKNIKAYSYEEVDKIFSKGRYKNSMDKMLLRLRSFMNEKLGIQDVNSHNLIEYFMIKANKSVGKYLVDSGLKTVLRSHSRVENIEKYVDGIEDEKLRDFLRIRNMKKAVYNFSSNNESDNYHFGLNLNYYTHFTSPIRRFPDILVHEALCKVCNIDNQFNIGEYDKSLLDEINEKEKRINKCERKLNKLRVIKDLEKKGDFERDYDGYITGFNDRFIEVFISSLKLEDKVRVVPRKFEELYDVDIVEDGLEMIIKKSGEEFMRFKIYDKVKLNITTFLNEEVFNNKIKIGLMNEVD
jgi:exoribonuclease R